MLQNNPTVFPMAPFDPRADAEALHKAMKGIGTDEKALINVLCHRTANQRVEISKAYKSIYGKVAFFSYQISRFLNPSPIFIVISDLSFKDLISKIKSETSGNFENLLVALCKSPDEYLASEIHHAISGLGTQEGTLIEILAPGNNQLIRDVTVAYKNCK